MKPRVSGNQKECSEEHEEKERRERQFFFFLSKRERGGSLDLGKGYTRFCLGGPGLSGWVM